MGACGRALRVAAGAPRAALRPLEVVRLRLRDRACLRLSAGPGTLPVPLISNYHLDGALGALANNNHKLAPIISELGGAILGLEGVGLRDGQEGKPRPYDVAFVRPSSESSRQLAFATFITPTHTGTWNTSNPEGQLCVEARFNPKRPFPELEWLKTKDFKAQGGGGWHCCCIDGQRPTISELFADVRMAFSSFP